MCIILYPDHAVATMVDVTVACIYLVVYFPHPDHNVKNTHTSFTDHRENAKLQLAIADKPAELSTRLASPSI